MRYFSEITPIFENYKARQIYIRESFDSKAKLVVRDTKDTSFIERDVRPSSVPYRECLGYSSDFGCVAIAMDAKRAELHEYLIKASTYNNVSQLLWHGVDKWTLGAKSGVVLGNSCIAIDTLNVSIKIDGSVCSWRAEAETLYSLYDILGRLCQETGINIMRYESIKLYSGVRRYKTVIELSQSVEAKRYFMKMYLDVSRKGWVSL